MDTFSESKDLLLKMHKDSLSGLISEKDLLNLFEAMCEKYDNSIKKKKLTFKLWENSSIRKVFQTHERIRLKREIEKTINLKRDLSNNTDPIIYYQYPALLRYLLLTCFDLLGQPDKWMDFSAWLKSSDNKPELESKSKRILNNNQFSMWEVFLKKIDTFLFYLKLKNPPTDYTNYRITRYLKFTNEINSFYSDKFSVAKSFFKFIDTVIPTNTKDELLSSIQIVEEYNSGEVKHLDSASKKKWLYRLRNDYTHSALAPEELLEPIYASENKNWLLRHTELKGNKTIYYYITEDFDMILEKTVVIGIISFIRKNSKK